MVISEVQHIIDSLEHKFPKSFIFVLDSTDRSFMYKSSNRHDCSEEIVRIDQQYGIDQLMSGLTFFMHREKSNRLLLKKVDDNSFLGACFLSKEYDDELLMRAKEILIK